MGKIAENDLLQIELSVLNSRNELQQMKLILKELHKTYLDTYL